MKSKLGYKLFKVIIALVLLGSMTWAFQNHPVVQQRAAFKHSGKGFARKPLVGSPGLLPLRVIKNPLTGEGGKVSSSEVPTALEVRDQKYWKLGPTLGNPNPGPLPEELRVALETNTHPVERQEDLGRGVFLVEDWRRAWHTYAGPPEEEGEEGEGGADAPPLVDPATGAAEYEIEEVDGRLPDDLVGVLYRNGPGLFGAGGERVSHVLDADGLVCQITFPPPAAAGQERQRPLFRSRFVETAALRAERAAGGFLYRGTFGTAPRGLAGLLGPPPRRGLNEDPSEPPLLAKVAGNALKTNIKNSANTQVVSFGGKVLALFEAGLPHVLDPVTLECLGEDDMGGTLPVGKLPVKLGEGIPTPDFVGGAAHTAHPNMCPRTGHLVGWHWSQLPAEKALEVTFTEWAEPGFYPVATSTFKLPGCELAPHDMALTENSVVLLANALAMDQGAFLSGLKGPAASLKMDGRAPVTAHIFPRPTSKNQFEPFSVEVPACFSIHFSHGYEDEDTGNIVCMFSGWPPSDSKDFLGAWGGFAPDFAVIPPTYLWKLEIDPVARRCVRLGIAPGAANACAEHPVVHPNFATRKAASVYASVSNLVGDSSAPCGYARLRIEDEGEREGGDAAAALGPGELNAAVDAYWFGTRRFSGEPLVVPKRGADPEDEDAAYLLGMMEDSVRQRTAVAVFDLERPLRDGPVCLLWLKSSVPHGLHGCFAAEGPGKASVFC